MLNFAWLPYSISAIISSFGLFSKPLPKGKSTRIDMVITTIGKQTVWDALLESVQETLNVSNGRVIVLTEPDANKKLVSAVQNMGAEIVIVPSWWEKGNAKGRAIWYFAQNIAEPDRWYMFLDDDSYPLDNRFQYEISSAEKRNRLAGNCVLVPRKGRSLLTLLCDNLRHTDDRTIFRLALRTIGSPLIGMHGEGLLVKGWVLKQYWKTHSIVEDAEFGINLDGKIKTFQSVTEISTLSAHSIFDFWKQRRRWYTGLWQIWGKFPLKAKPLLTLRLVSWSLGFLGIINWILIPYFLLTGLNLEISTVGIITTLGFSLLVSYYLVGAKRTGTVIPAMVLFPVYTAIETFMPLYTLLTYRNRRRGFEVIEKNKVKIIR